jgi:hypothetical protein
MIVDHLRDGEQLPDGALLLPDAEDAWIWVARDQFDVIVAYLVAVRGHGLVMPIRLHRLDVAPLSCINALLRTAIRECEGRGYRMYLTWIGSDSEGEKELREMCRRRGAREFPMNGAIVVGRMEAWR